MTRISGPVVGLLLAAGRGARFDPAGKRNKLLQAIDGSALAARSAMSLAQSCGHCIAVVRPGADAVVTAIRAGGIDEIVTCPDAERGMGHSLAAAASAAKRLSPSMLVVMLADLPWLQPRTISLLIDAAELALDADPMTIVVPSYAGRQGHPVVFGAMHLGALTRCAGDRGAAELLREYPVERIEVDDAGVLRDVDTPADLNPSDDC